MWDQSPVLLFILERKAQISPTVSLWKAARWAAALSGSVNKGELPPGLLRAPAAAVLGLWVH